jgi:hypothetical protein
LQWHSRELAEEPPGFFATYAGDVLWAATLYWFLGLLLPKQSTHLIAISALEAPERSAHVWAARNAWPLRGCLQLWEE